MNLALGSLLLASLTLTSAVSTRSQDAGPQTSQTGVSPANWRQVIETARPAVVLIRTDKAQGSGFLMKADGTIATNAHVIAGASTIEVKLATGEVYRRVFVVTMDESEDVAILRIEAVDLPVLSLANSNDVKVGDDVLLVGAPLGLEETISTGLVSAIRVSESGLRVIQTTAAASPGSSGGPLLNSKGEVIGLLSFGAVKGQNLNFAIPINYVRGKLDTILLSGAARLVDSTAHGTPDQEVADVRRRSGVIFSGLSGPGTPQGSFQFIYVQLLDFLSGQGVDMMNETASFKPTTSQVVSLNYYLDHLGGIGASGLLYMIVEHPYQNRYGIKLQCFDAKGKLLWEEKESKSGWSETGGANGALDAIKKKLKPHLGSPGLLLKRSQNSNSGTNQSAQ